MGRHNNTKAIEIENNLLTVPVAFPPHKLLQRCLGQLYNSPAVKQLVLQDHVALKKCLQRHGDEDSTPTFHRSMDMFFRILSFVFYQTLLELLAAIRRMIENIEL